MKIVKSITEINKMADKHAQSWLGVHTSKYMTNGELLPKFEASAELKIRQIPALSHL